MSERKEMNKAWIRMAIFLLLILFNYIVYHKPPTLPSFKAKPLTEQNILEEMQHERLEKQYQQAAAIAGMVYRRNGCRSAFAVETGRAAVSYRISPRVLAALVFVESSCNPNAISPDGSVGLTQPNVKIWKFTRAQLLNPEFNLKAGASILASDIRKYGLKQGLHAYNGFGNPTNEYAEKVLTAAGIQVL